MNILMRRQCTHIKACMNAIHLKRRLRIQRALHNEMHKLELACYRSLEYVQLLDSLRQIHLMNRWAKHVSLMLLVALVGNKSFYAHYVDVICYLNALTNGSSLFLHLIVFHQLVLVPTSSHHVGGLGKVIFQFIFK